MLDSLALFFRYCKDLIACFDIDIPFAEGVTFNWLSFSIGAFAVTVLLTFFWRGGKT